MPHGCQQCVIILLDPHQDGTNLGLSCAHAIWSLVGLWAVFQWVKRAGFPSLIFLGTFCSRGVIIVSTISLFKEVMT